MIAYSYDKDTKEYVGPVKCQLDPLQTKSAGQDVWLVPAHAIYDVPPEKPVGKTVVYDNGVWVVVNDYRGKRAYNNVGVFVVDYIGDLKDGDVILTDEQVDGLDNGILVWKDGQIVPKPEPTIEQQVVALEQAYSMVRWQREGILAEGSVYSVYVKAKAQEIEELAEQLRVQQQGE